MDVRLRNFPWQGSVLSLLALAADGYVIHQQQPDKLYFRRMSFLTEVTPPTLRVTATALSMSELVARNPLS